MAFVSESSFFRIQTLYAVLTIKKYWDELLTETLKKHAEETKILLGEYAHVTVGFMCVGKL